MAKKQSAKDRMKAAEQWVNDYQPKKFGVGNFQKNLENGIALGHVALGIDPNLAKKHFKQKDLQKPKIGPFPNKVRITAFIEFCKAYGCDERDVFRTVYLSEPKDQKDLDHVVRTLENLSSLIESKGGKQSRLIGISGRKKLAQSNDPNYKKAQSQSVDSYGIVKHPNVAKSSWTAKQYDATHKSKPKTNTSSTPSNVGKVNTSKWDNKNTSTSAPKKWGNNNNTNNSVKSALWGNNNTTKNKPTPPPAPKTNTNKKKASFPSWSNKKNDNNNNDDYKAPPKSSNSGLTYTDNPNKNKSFGFSAEQKQKQASKYNMDMEKQVVSWINKVVGGVKGGGAANLQKSLKDGTILCKLINSIKPNSIKSKICTAGVGKTGAMASFNDKQRINEFSRCAKQMGLMAASSFEADDLWEGNNMTAVLVGLYGFGVVCQQKKYPGAKGGIVGKGKNQNRGGGLY